MSETVCHFGHGCFAYDTGNCGNGSYSIAGPGIRWALSAPPTDPAPMPVSLALFRQSYPFTSSR